MPMPGRRPAAPAACHAWGMTETTVRLSDGRQLAYREQGDPAGRPVLLFHGSPGSRVQHHPDPELARQAGVRLITADRPGYGLSDAAPGRSLRDWAGDTAQLADALGLDRFSIIGISGAGVFALACAWLLTEGIERLLLVSSPAPLQAPGVKKSLPAGPRFQLGVAARFPLLLRLVFSAYYRSARRLTPEKIRRKLRQELPPAEQSCLDAPGFPDMLLADAQEGGRQGAAATALELALIARPWDIPLTGIRVPTRVWQGEADTTVSQEMGEWLAGEIPGCRATFVPDAGHLLAFSHWQELLHEAAGKDSSVLQTAGPTE